jgi:hypothetical protein
MATNELRLHVENANNSRIYDYRFDQFFQNVNRFNPRENVSYPYIEKRFFVEEKQNMIGIRDISEENNLYDIYQKIGDECDPRLGVNPTTKLRTPLGQTEPLENEQYWTKMFGAVEDLPVQPFQINQITHSLNQS